MGNMYSKLKDQFTVIIVMLQVYKDTSKRTDLEGSITLLQQTAQLIDIFTDQRVVRSVEDNRLKKLLTISEFFKRFAQNGAINFQKNFFSRESYDDLQSMLIGTCEMVKTKLRHHPMGYICLCRLNTDVVENFFSSMRAINGSNTNPTYLQYRKGINTIAISQTVVSKKANAGGTCTIAGALPYKFHAKKSFKKLRV